MHGFGRLLIWLGVVGLALGIGPLLVVGIINPKSTAVGPGLLMVLMTPPSLLCLGLGLVLRAIGKSRKLRRAGEAIEQARADQDWRALPPEPTGRGRLDPAA